MANQSYVMYTAWSPLFLTLPKEQAGELIQAICAYQDGEEYTPEDATVAAMFAMIRGVMAKDRAKYAETCAKRADAAKQKHSNKSKSVQMQANAGKTVQKNPDNEYEYDNDNDNEYEYENDKHKKHRRVYAQDERLDAAIREFIKHRQKMRKPMTDHAVDLLLTKLAKITTDVDEQVKLIDTAIEKGWQTVYPPKEETRTGSAYMDAIANRVSVVDSWV